MPDHFGPSEEPEKLLMIVCGFAIAAIAPAYRPPNELVLTVRSAIVLMLLAPSSRQFCRVSTRAFWIVLALFGVALLGLIIFRSYLIEMFVEALS